MQKYHGVCAGVRNGDYFGRNLDWSCGESPEFIVHTPATDGRHATLGVCTTKMIGKIDPNGEKWMSQFLLNELTSVCYDGINDAGVCMVLLVVHYEDGNGIPTGTNPNAKQDIHGMNVIRYVLDNANSAAHAVELLNNINSFGTLEHYTFHWLLSDEKENYFVELIGNKMAITKVEENPIEKFRKPMLTNFYMQKDTTEQHIPGGVERYNLLVKDYDKTNTADGMFSALKNIRFSRKYEGKNPATLNGALDNNWYSEFYCEMWNFKTFTPYNFTKESSRQEIWDCLIADDIEMNDISKFANPRMNPASSWTCHTSVYNIKERTLQIVTGENYDNVLPSKTTYFKIKK